MASEKLMNGLIDQMNFELLSGYYYLAMASYVKSEDFEGSEHFLIEQAKEEYDHAMKFYDFIIDMDGRAIMQALEAPKNDYNSLLEVFQAALAHEELVTSKIYALLDLAKEENCHQTIHFLQWFVEEQLEEENSMKYIVALLEKTGDNFVGQLMIDKQLGSR